jgi:hypothetical protein
MILRLSSRLRHMKHHLINTINNFIRKSNNIPLHHTRKNDIKPTNFIPPPTHTHTHTQETRWNDYKISHQQWRIVLGLLVWYYFLLGCDVFMLRSFCYLDSICYTKVKGCSFGDDLCVSEHVIRFTHSHQYRQLLPNTLSLLEYDMDCLIQVCSVRAITLRSYRSVCIACFISERTSRIFHIRDLNCNM